MRISYKLSVISYQLISSNTVFKLETGNWKLETTKTARERCL